MKNAPFPIQPELTSIAIAYANRQFIADQVLPRKPVGTQEFKYLLHEKSFKFSIPNTLVGRKGKPNEVEMSATELTAATRDYGLEDGIPQADIDNAPVNYDPLGEAVEGLQEVIQLDREKRTADLVFNANTYPVGNKQTLSGTSQWSDFTNSDPLYALMTALDIPLIRPNVMVIGRPAFTILAMHPKIVKAAHGNSGDSGRATRMQLAELLELEEVIVGESFYNASVKGQDASYQRLWGKHCSLIHRNQTANTQRGVTFGLTAQWGDRIAGSWEDKNIGLRGGQRVRTGESVRELITAADTGYFFQDVVA